jgi:UDP-glucuronate 4-epimerase
MADGDGREIDAAGGQKMLMSETDLVTGGTGLAGHHVLRSLIDRGVAPEHIVAYDLDPRQQNVADIEGEFTLVEGDITDEAALEAAFDRFDPTRVIHLAALLVYDGWENAEAVIDVNGIGTTRVFAAVATHDIDRCVYASTAGVYGDAGDYGGPAVPVGEDDLVKPIGPYGATKYLNEVVARQYNEHSDAEYVGVRVGGVWGRGRLSGSTGEFTRFVREAALGRAVSLPQAWIDIFGTTGDVYASYGRDFGRWFADLATMDGVDHQLYNQRNEDSFTLEEVANALERLVPETTVEVPVEGSSPTGSPPPLLDATRWYDELGFSQEWDIEAALVDFVNYQRKQESLDPI